MNNVVYLDNAATTRLSTVVYDRMSDYLFRESTEPGPRNPGSIYSLGKIALHEVNQARKHVSNLLLANEEDIIFTSSGSEANTLAIEGVADWMKTHGKTKIITSAVEHESVMNAVEGVCIKHGFYKIVIPVNSDGCADMNYFRESLTPEVGLVSIMYANNELAGVNDVAEIAQLCKDNGSLFHTDCVQAAGFYALHVNEIQCDMLSISSHKIHGPKGVGCLYVRDKSILKPVIYGGSNQEYGLRGGTENVAGIVGFGSACEMLNMIGVNNIRHELSSYWDIFLENLYCELERRGISKDIIQINSKQPCSKVLNIQIKGIDAETMIILLALKGIYVSAGSACSNLHSSPSRVLTAAGVDAERARQSIRLSISRYNDIAEIKTACEAIADCVIILRNMSE